MMTFEKTSMTLKDKKKKKNFQQYLHVSTEIIFFAFLKKK